MGLMVGERFGRYRIDAEIGGGGMGRVFRAWDTHLARAVALKVLHHAGPLGELLREARSAAALHHRNAVAIHDVCEIDGLPVLVMELVEGVSLRALIRSNAPTDARVRWLLDLARVLAAAHRLGLVHRDVKPDNAMIARDGTLKVLDFGIAKVVVTAAAGAPTVAGAWATLDGTVKGTPAYMAPEQLGGIAVDGRADIYAWGVTAYEMLTGIHPADLAPGASTTEVTYVIQPPPASVVAPAIASELSAIVTRSMAKRVDDRFATMDDVVAALERVAGAPAEVASPVARAPVPHAESAPTVVDSPAAVGRAPAATARGGRGWIAAALVAAVLGVVVAVTIAATRTAARAGPDAQPPVAIAAVADARNDPWAPPAAEDDTAEDDKPAEPVDAGTAIFVPRVRPDAASRAGDPDPPPAGRGCADHYDCDLAGGELCRDRTCQMCPPGSEPALGRVCGKRCRVATDCAPDEICDLASLLHRYQTVCIGCPRDRAWYAGGCRFECGARKCLAPWQCQEVSVDGTRRELCLPEGSTACPRGQIVLTHGGTCGVACRDQSDCTGGKQCQLHECVDPDAL